MGFFNKLKGALNKIEDVKRAIENNGDSNRTAAATPPQPAVSAPKAENKAYNTDDGYFASLITEGNFPGYSIARGVHAQRLDGGAHPSCYPISYLFSDDEGPVLAVLVMNTNQYRSMIARGTYEVLEKKGIKYIRFFKGMENERSYVINRINENLR